MTVHVSAEADAKQGPGYAVIRVQGANVAPDGIRVHVRRPGYRDDNLGPTGWQAAEASLTPDAVYVAHGVLTLHVGPAIVSHMEPGMNVAFVLELPDGKSLYGQLAWPAIAGPIGGARARRGRMVATQRVATEAEAMRSGGALVGDVAPVAAEVAPPPLPAQAETTAAAAEPTPEADALAASQTPEVAESDQTADAEPAPAGETAEAELTQHAGLRAERDNVAASARPRTPWKRRVAFAASIAVLLVAGAAAASVYFGREQICANESLGGVADDWGLCPPVVVAETPPPAADPAGESGDDGNSWNINPLAWLGPQETDTGDAQPGAAADDQDEVAPPPPSPESQRALARQYLETEPSPEDAFARAGELLAEGQVEAAFLIYRYAAERGYADAATAVAAMYDPETYTPQTSPLPRPNPSVARIWYERAVAAGDNAALLSLARLLADQESVDEARALLRQAEEAGLIDAADRLLEELE